MCMRGMLAAVCAHLYVKGWALSLHLVGRRGETHVTRLGGQGLTHWAISLAPFFFKTKKKSLFAFLELFVHVWPACICVYLHVCLVLEKVRREQQILDWVWLWVTVCVLGIEPGFSTRARHTLNSWATSPSDLLFRFIRRPLCICGYPLTYCKDQAGLEFQD